jgi:GTP:adenosylcobinamide-phosphate guanylyltransferase
MNKVTAVVLAGSRPGGDPFAEAYGTDLKALIPVAGTPMVQRPVEALLACDRVEAIHVLAQNPDRIRKVLRSDPRVTVEQSGQTIASTLEAFCFDPNMRWPVLVTTSDHALLTPEMVEEFLAKVEGAEVAIGVVSRDAMLKRFPQAQRTWLKFRSGAYSGANLFLLANPDVRTALELWRSNEQDRKKAWRMLFSLGLIGFLGAALRIRTLQQTLDAIGRKLRLKIRAVEMSDPLAAIDVDKPADHELVTAILEGRG